MACTSHLKTIPGLRLARITLRHHGKPRHDSQYEQSIYLPGQSITLYAWLSRGSCIKVEYFTPCQSRGNPPQNLEGPSPLYRRVVQKKKEIWPRGLTRACLLWYNVLILAKYTTDMENDMPKEFREALLAVLKDDELRTLIVMALAELFKAIKDLEEK